jgi:transposase InsO family protein
MGVDFIVVLPECQGYNSIMMIVDHLSKDLYAIPCNTRIDSKGAATLAHNHVWTQEGVPQQIISDRGLQFASEFTKELLRILGIKQGLSTTYHPQTDGQTERLNQEIHQYFQVFVNYCTTRMTGSTGYPLQSSHTTRNSTHHLEHHHSLWQKEENLTGELNPQRKPRSLMPRNLPIL